MYKVLKTFTDLQDGRHEYKVGSAYPRPELKPTAKRIQELSGNSNRQGVPLIEAFPEEPAKSKAQKG